MKADEILNALKIGPIRKIETNNQYAVNRLMTDGYVEEFFDKNPDHDLGARNWSRHIYIRLTDKPYEKKPGKRNRAVDPVTEMKLDDVARIYLNTDTTLQQIGVIYGVTRERVGQWLKKRGITAKDGGRHRRVVEATELKQVERLEYIERRNAEFSEKYGCPLGYVYEVNGGMPLTDKNSPSAAYWNSKNGLQRTYGTTFMTFPEWWSLWQESGKWSERGRGRGYVIRRIDKAKPYSKENCRIMRGDESMSITMHNLHNKKSLQDAKT